MIRALLLLFLLFLSGGVFCQDVYKGSIGNTGIIARIELFDDSSLSMFYFSVDNKKNIKLAGKFDGKVFTSDNDSNEFGRFMLVKTGSSYKGSWEKDDKTYPVNLQSTDVNEYRNEYASYDQIAELKSSDPYFYIFSSFLTAAPDTMQAVKHLNIGYLKEETTGVPLMQIMHSAKDAALEKINHQLKETWLSECIAQFDCAHPYLKTEYFTSLESIHIVGSALSIRFCHSYYCGGMYPDWACPAMNFDLVTGKLLVLEDVVWFGKGVVPTEGSADWNTYRSEVFAPKILSVLKFLYPKEIVDTESECGYDDPSPWEYPNWYFTDKGLFVGADFPHARAACRDPEWAIIPYARVNRFRNATVKLKLPMK
jgi:hypothetical protein